MNQTHFCLLTADGEDWGGEAIIYAAAISTQLCGLLNDAPGDSFADSLEVPFLLLGIYWVAFSLGGGEVLAVP